jgi:hypothetical protein
MTEEIIPPDQVAEALAGGTSATPEPAAQVEVNIAPPSKPAYPARGILLPAAERADWSVRARRVDSLPDVTMTSRMVRRN